VSYKLCLPPEQVTVPNNLVGSTKEVADAALRERNLTPQYKEVNSSKQAGIVTNVQHAGDKVDPGTTIQVSISKGNQLKMPKVTGQSEETALALLDQAGDGTFNVSQKQVAATDPSQVGTVVAQDPQPGATVEKGDKVTITVAIDATNPSGEPTPTDTETPGGNGGGTGGGTVIDQTVAVLRPND
jgi:serine/threonine-protein kinase